MQIKLITAVATQVLTAAATKARLKITDTAQDSVIAEYIAEMRASCQSKTNRGIGAQTWQLAFNCFEDKLPLILPPLIAVDWVKYYNASNTLTTLATDQYTVDDFSEPGAIVPAPYCVWPVTYPVVNAVRVQIQCGYVAANLPEELRNWMYANIGHFEKNREVFTADAKSDSTIVDGLLDAHRIWPGR